MKNFRRLACASLALGLLLTAGPASAQVNISAPLVVRSSGAKASSGSLKGSWLKAEVIRADSNSIVVREQVDGRMVHTFTYAPELQAQMQKLADQGGYQYGDKVRILYQQGQTVALRVRGKPSKAL
jgi:hypothetical protein